MKRREHRLGVTIYGSLLYVGTVFAKDKELIAREYANIYCSAHRNDRRKIIRRIVSGTKGYEVVPLSISRARKMPAEGRKP